MGYTKAPTIFTLVDVDGEEGFIVRMKALRIGRLRKLIRIIEADGEDLSESLSEIFDLVADGIVSWNLEDENGPVPADASGIESLEMPTLMGLLSAWLDEMTGVSEDLGKDSPSGKQFPGQPVTMELL